MNMSFALTTEQMERREKTVTRRLRWRHARVGQVVNPIFKDREPPVMVCSGTASSEAKRAAERAGAQRQDPSLTSEQP